MTPDPWAELGREIGWSVLRVAAGYVAMVGVGLAFVAEVWRVRQAARSG